MDDDVLNRITRLYGKPDIDEKRMYTVEVKRILSDIVVDMVENHQRNKTALTKDVMDEVFSVRKNN